MVEPLVEFAKITKPLRDDPRGIVADDHNLQGRGEVRGIRTHWTGTLPTLGPTKSLAVAEDMVVCRKNLGIRLDIPKRNEIWWLF